MQSEGFFLVGLTLLLGVLVAVQSGALSGPWDFWRTLYGVSGLVATVLPLVVLVPDRRGRSVPAEPA